MENNNKIQENDEYIIKEKFKKAFDIWVYSIHRADLLIISFSGAGIYLCLTAMQVYIEKQYCVPMQIKISGLLFIITIILNLISQITSERCTANDILFYEVKLQNKYINNSENKELELKYDQKSQKLSTITRWINSVSIFSLLAGIVVLTSYFISL